MTNQRDAILINLTALICSILGFIIGWGTHGLYLSLKSKNLI